MASSIARRIAAGLSCLMVVSVAFADWGSTHYCRLSEDRLLIIPPGKRFVLTHAAAWELVDSAQQNEFDKWLNQSKLSKDLGQLVSSAPLDHAYPLAGEVEVTEAGDATTNLEFRIGSNANSSLKLTSSSEGAKLDSIGSTAFTGIAKALGKSPSTLLVILADTGSKVSDTKAWGLVLARLKAKHEFFCYVDKQHGLLWIKRVKPISAGSSADSSSKPEHSASSESPKTNPPKPKPDSTGDTGNPIIWAGVAIILGGIGGYLLGQRTPSRAQQAGKDASLNALPKFMVNPKERELIEMARAEMERLGWSSHHIPTAEEFVVREVQERYHRHDALVSQVELLKSYREFAEDRNAFQKRIDSAVAEAQSNRTQADELSRQLQEQRARLVSLSEQLRSLQAERDHALKGLSETEKLVDDMVTWTAFLDERLNQLMEQMQHE